MLKQLVFGLSLAVCLIVTGFTQDKNDNVLKDPHTKIDSSKVLKVDENNLTVAKEPWNKVCPVKGETIEADSPTVEYKGKVYAFCCPGCDTKFSKDPEKYLKNLSEDGKTFVGRK